MDPELKFRLSSLKHHVNKLHMYKTMLDRQISDSEIEEKKLQYHADLRKKEGEVFKNWLDESIHKNIDSISKLVTTGLRHIIHDQNINFHIRSEPKANKLHMKFVVEQDGIEGDPIDSFGGGAAVVISFILRLAVMSRMGMGNLLILDESLAALANAYVPFCGSFMKQLSEQTGVNILMVTHNEEFLKYAHTAYEGHKDGSLKLRKIRNAE